MAILVHKASKVFAGDTIEQGIYHYPIHAVVDTYAYLGNYVSIKGANGSNGAAGISPTVSVTDISGGHRVTITDKDGAKAFDVMDGKDGQGGGGTSVQADMAQNDPNQPDYVKNRTHWAEGNEIPIQGMWVESERMYFFGAPLGLELGETYIVTWDGAEHECVAHEVEFQGVTAIALGNTPLYFGTGNTGDPFVLGELPAEAVAMMGAYGFGAATDYSINHAFSIRQEVVHKIDNKFIDAEWMATNGDVDIIHKYTGTASEAVGNNYGMALPNTAGIINAIADGTNVRVYINGVCYPATKIHNTDGDYIVAYGSTTADFIDGKFVFMSLHASLDAIFIATEPGQYTVRVVEEEEGAIKIPAKFLPVDYINSLIDAKLGVIANAAY